MSPRRFTAPAVGGGGCRQADLRGRKGDPAYEPLIEVEGLECWPSEPLWEQLADGAQLAH